jgi:regulator of PEP synthase PpsR (kinase-PPPase family)
MSNTYQIYLISDSTGETLRSNFLALKHNLKILNIKFTLILSQELKIKFLKF